MRIKVDSPTIWGYDQDDIKLARKLMECGITPHELKEHLHDFEWVVKKVMEDVERVIQAPIQEVTKSQKRWSFFNDNKPYEIDCAKMGWKKPQPYWRDGFDCPICGKHVGSMEVHPCNQPYYCQEGYGSAD